MGAVDRALDLDKPTAAAESARSGTERTWVPDINFEDDRALGCGIATDRSG